MRRFLTIERSFLVAVMFFLNSCSLKEAPPLDIYTITPTTEVTISENRRYRNKVIKVALPLSIKEPLSYKMIYAYSPNRRGYYQNAQWANSIAKLIQGSIIRVLQKSRLYKAVVPLNSSVQEDLRLESMVNDLCHYVVGDDSYVLLSMTFTLVDMDSGRIVRRRHFEYKANTESVDAKGYVAALNRIVMRLKQDLLRWLEEM